MKKFKLSVVIPIVIITQLFVLHNAHAETLYPVKVDYQPTKVRFSKVKVKLTVINQKEQIVLRGVVKRRIYNSHILPDHIDYIVLDSREQILQQGAIQVSGINLRHNRYGRQFSLLLPDALPGGSTIKLGWHNNQTSVLSAPAYHYKNLFL
jgi:hypothetical protein